MRYLIIFLCLFLPSINQANAQKVNNPELEEWVYNAASEVMSFDFSNFEERKKENRRFFTEKGYKSFYKAMERAQYSETLQKHKFVVETKPLCTAFISPYSDSSDNLIAQIPTKTLWFNDKGQRNDFMRATIVLEPANSNAHKIAQWIAVPIKEDEVVCDGLDPRKSEILKLKREIEKKQKRIHKLEAELK